MPSVNIYSSNEQDLRLIANQLSAIREIVALQLSCTDRRLSVEEVSVRLIPVLSGSLMISSLEIEITAFSYAERVANQDIICRAVASEIWELNPDIAMPHVWLVLCELGHSWQE